MENNYSKVVYLGTPYAFAISLAYLFGYWSTFDINILEYISFSEVIKLSLYPLVASLLFFVLGLLYGGLKAAESIEIKKDKNNGHRRLINLVLIFCAIILILLDRCYVWLIVAYLCSFLLCIILDNDIWFEAIFPNFPPKLKSAVQNILIFLPFLAFAYGKIDGEHIIIGHDTHFVSASILRENKLLTG